jgi:hypothetical protein
MYRSVSTTSNRNQVVFCRCILFCKESFLSLVMRTQTLTVLPEYGFYEDHTTLVVILCTLQQWFPYQLFLFQCWGPCVILHWTIHTETCSHKRHTEGKTSRHTKFWYPCRTWVGWRCSSEDPYTPGL